MMRRVAICLTVSGFLLAFPPAGFTAAPGTDEESFSKENRDKTYEFFGRDGRVYDSTEEYAVQTIPARFGRLVAVLVSPSNPKQRELWFESNDGTARRVILVPVKNRRPPFMVYREVIRFERD